MIIEVPLIEEAGTLRPDFESVGISSPAWERVSFDQDGGTATVKLTGPTGRKVLSEARDAALAFNGGSSWGDIKAVTSPTTLHKKLLVEKVKKEYSEFSGPVPQGFVVSHSNALWKATAQTSTEPSTTSDDWTLIFEV